MSIQPSSVNTTICIRFKNQMETRDGMTVWSVGAGGHEQENVHF